jgi:hypothetical protein
MLSPRTKEKKMAVISLCGRLPKTTERVHTSLSMETGELVDPDKKPYIMFPVAEYDFFMKKNHFFNVKFFGKLAQIVARMWEEGRWIYVVGDIKQEEFTTQDGRKITRYAVFARSATFPSGFSDDRSVDEVPKSEPKKSTPQHEDEYPDDGDLPF